MNALRLRASKIRMVIFDVDGVLTDGKLHIGNAGELYKSFDARDGFGITLLRLSGFKTAVITGRVSDIVARRSAELKIDEVCQGEKNKVKAMRAIMDKYGMRAEEVAYVGDDLMDIPPMKNAGLSCAVGDAVSEVKEAAHFTAAACGGSGAARQIAEMILRAQGKWEQIILAYQNEKPLEDHAQ